MKLPIWQKLRCKNVGNANFRLAITVRLPINAMKDAMANTIRGTIIRDMEVVTSEIVDHVTYELDER